MSKSGSNAKRVKRSSKFQNKYKDRINSIKHTEENIIENRKRYEDTEMK